MIKKIIPSLLSSIRVIFALLMLYFFENLSLVLVLFGLSALADFFDGYFARKFNASSTVGGFIDGISDKLFMGIVIIGFFVIRGISLWYLVLFFSREILEVYGIIKLRIQQKRLPDFQSNMLGKVTTVVQFFAVLFLIINKITIFLILVYVVFVLSVFTYVDYARKYRK
tara:strand:+ start:695 stop:1201 length:507 start_codon:yes stop_codon:yes gene_type:complete